MSKRSVTALSILGLIVAALLFFQTPLMRTARAVAWNVWVHTVARVFQQEWDSPRDAVSAQLQSLQAENARLRAEIADYYRLRQQLASPAFESYRAIPALVSGRPIDGFRTQYVINRGSSDGVVAGAPVTTAGSVLVGFITDLQEHTATFQLLFHPSTSLTVEIVPDDLDNPPPRGLLVGRHYTSLVTTTIPRNAAIREGMSVVTVAKEPLLAHGLLVGTIHDLRSKPEDAYQEAAVEAPYNPDSLAAVTVLVQP